MDDSPKILSDEQTNGANPSESERAFVPVPLKHVDAKQLAKIPTYIKSDNEYCLYSSNGLGFTNDDRKRLLASDVKYVFISSKDKSRFFDLMGESLLDTIKDNSISIAEKQQIMHETAVSLAGKLNQTLPNQKDLDQTITSSDCNAQLMMAGMSLKEVYRLCTKDPDDAAHLVKMASIMQGFATKLGLTDKDALSMMGAGALLHDIGKIHLPKENRTPAMIRSHVELGIKHLDTLNNVPMEIISIVAEHHERVDGSGYPYGLKGNDISLIGQLAGLAYTFEQLTSDFSYRNEKQSIVRAIELLETQYNKQFDPAMLNSFISYANTVLLDEAENKVKLSQFSLAGIDSENKKINPSGRRHQRFFFRCKGTAEILYLKNEKWAIQSSHDVIMHNISQSGMGFMSYKPFDISQIVLAKVYIGSTSEPVCLLGKVKRVQEVTKDLFVIGAAFFETNSQEGTRALFERLNRLS
ncbi:MAG: HD domain-containing protein [Sedimentisphaerales bacterium]|nr:HD domain-containing protein [Sedimentisphaerales bacterium]MBN2843602.1 HD domain-containing protein [Sedimentisphaerales bacterium]